MKLKLKLFVVIAAFLVTPALPGVAGAHVEVEPTEVPAGKPAELNFSVGHGCEGAATTSLTVQVPKSVANYEAASVDGWKATNPSGQMKWVGGPLPDHEVQEYPLTATFYGKKDARFPFKLIQGCEGGVQTAWIQVVPAGAPEPETPAPTVTLTSAAVAPAVPPTGSNGAGTEGESFEKADPAETTGPVDEDEGLTDGLIIAMFALAGVAILAGGIYWVRRNSDH